MCMKFIRLSLIHHIWCFWAEGKWAPAISEPEHMCDELPGFPLIWPLDRSCLLVKHCCLFQVWESGTLSASASDVKARLAHIVFLQRQSRCYTTKMWSFSLTCTHAHTHTPSVLQSSCQQASALRADDGIEQADVQTRLTESSAPTSTHHKWVIKKKQQEKNTLFAGGPCAADTLHNGRQNQSSSTQFTWSNCTIQPRTKKNLLNKWKVSLSSEFAWFDIFRAETNISK